jgi:putative SOS response-associated peptidase YedK
MCNQYNVKTNLSNLATELDAQIAFQFECSDEVFPGAVSPVLAVNRDGQSELRPMKFGFGSIRTTGPPLNNARVESIEKWTWKKSFQRYRCVVPMDAFREPCYWGPEAGKELTFSDKKGSSLLAAAIFSFAKSGDGQSVCCMSLVMRPAVPYVMAHGHHRSPFFLRRDALETWMDRQPRSIEQVRGVLRHAAHHPDLGHRVARQMAESWTKRKAAKLDQRDKQIAAVEASGPLGLD